MTKSLKNPVIILAGGYGTRLGALTQSCPKPMISVLGRPFLSWLLKHLTAEGFTSFILSTGYLAETIESHPWTSEFPGCSFEFQRELRPLGTGGAIQRVYQQRPELDEALIVNGDTLLPDLLTPHAENRHGHDVLYVAQLARFIVDAKPNLKTNANLVTAETADGDLFHAGPIFINRAAVSRCEGVPPLSMGALLGPTLKMGQATFSLSEKPCFDIGTPERLKRFENYLRERFGSESL